jgi:16S rRNA (uracil1498-N3)-methyltransferase
VNVILCEPTELGADGSVRLTGDRARHVLRVLKAGVGQQVRVGVVDAAMGVGTVRRIDGDTVEVACAFESTVPPAPPVDILIALPRPKVMRRLWAPLAALGVGRIVLTNAARVERQYFDTHVLDAGTYRPLLVEGLQQARDTRVPVVSVHRQFRVLVEDELDGLCPQQTRLVAQPGAQGTVADRLRARGSDRVLLAIGPEGGWNDFELELLQARGFHTMGLGPRTLRTDTACIAVLAVVNENLSSSVTA